MSRFAQHCLLLSIATASPACGDDSDPGQADTTGSTGPTDSTDSTDSMQPSTSSTPDGTSTGAVGADSDSSGGTTSIEPADDSSDDDTTEGGVDGPLSRLDPGPHLGMIVGFELPARGTEATVQGHWDDAVAAGMDIGRVQVDWAELEPSPGVFVLDELEEALQALEDDGLQIMVTLSTIDSFEYTMPADLVDLDQPLALTDGMTFDDPVVTERFAALLDVVIPVVIDHGGFLITVGNEPDNHFEDNPAFAAEVAGFTAAAREHAATIDSTLAISMTLTYGSVDTYAVSTQILDVVDVATFNFYCDGEGADIAGTVAPRMAAMLDVAGDKPIVIQELGCHAGWDDTPSVLGTSPEAQAAFFEAVRDEMLAEPRLRAAYVFQLLDWSPALTDLFAAELLAGGFDQATIDFFTESLGTLGLCRWSNATCRPAWNVVLDALGALKTQQ